MVDSWHKFAPCAVNLFLFGQPDRLHTGHKHKHKHMKRHMALAHSSHEQQQQQRQASQTSITSRTCGGARSCPSRARDRRSPASGSAYSLCLQMHNRCK